MDTKRLIRAWLWVSIFCLVIAVLTDMFSYSILKNYECSSATGDPEEGFGTIFFGTLYSSTFFAAAFASFRTESSLSKLDEAYFSEQNMPVFMGRRVLITMIDIIIMPFFAFTFFAPALAAWGFIWMANACDVPGHIPLGHGG